MESFLRAARFDAEELGDAKTIINSGTHYL
jgi:hypothetical protein